MKYLRHLPLVFYTLAVLAAAGVLAAAYVVGRQHRVDRAHVANPIAAVTEVSALRLRMVALPGLLPAPAALHRWGVTEAAMASRDASARQRALGRSDVIVRAFRTVASDSERLGTHGYDSMSAIGDVMDAGDALERLVLAPLPPAAGSPSAPVSSSSWPSGAGTLPRSRPPVTPTTEPLPARLTLPARGPSPHAPLAHRTSRGARP